MKTKTELKFISAARQIAHRNKLGEFQHAKSCARAAFLSRKCDCGLSELLEALNEFDSEESPPPSEPDYNEGWKTVASGPDSRGWRTLGDK